MSHGHGGGHGRSRGHKPSPLSNIVFPIQIFCLVALGGLWLIQHLSFSGFLFLLALGGLIVAAACRDTRP